MFYFFGVKGVIRSYRSAQELKADTLTLTLTLTSLPYTGELEGSITFGFNFSNSSNSKEVEQLAKLESILLYVYIITVPRSFSVQS